MGSQLGPQLANIFMISLKEVILPSIKRHVSRWKRKVNSIHYIDPSKIVFVLEKFNSHHFNIQFTQKIHEKQKLIFLDVLIACK